MLCISSHPAPELYHELWHGKQNRGVRRFTLERGGEGIPVVLNPLESPWGAGKDADVPETLQALQDVCVDPRNLFF